MSCTGEGSIRSVVLLEDPADTPVALTRAREMDNEAILIPLTPSASYSLDQRKILHRNVQSYSGGDELYRTGLDNYRRIEAFFQVLEPELKNLHRIPSLEPARYTMYSLKILIDVLCTSITLIQRIIKKEQPGSICIPRKQSPVGSGRGAGFSNGESVTATILSLDGWGVPVEFLERGTSHASDGLNKAGDSPRGEHLRQGIRSRASLLNLGIILKRGSAVSATGGYVRGLFRKSGGPVLIYGSGYNWDDALAELYRGGWRPVHRISDGGGRPPSPSSPLAPTIQGMLRKDSPLRNLTPFLGIDTWPFLSERISAIVSDSVTESIESYRQTQNLIAEKGIRALLISVTGRPAGHAAARAARDAGIPVISWQHGGAGYAFHPMMPYLECANSDLHLVFGTPVAEKYLEAMEWLGWNHSPPVAPVGSSSLDAMRRRFSGMSAEGDDGPVLYVTTGYLHHIFYVSQPRQMIGWDEHLWQVQKSVVDLAGQHPDREIVIKLPPGDRTGEPLGSYIRDSAVSNIRCITNESTLAELLPGSSLILFDLVSTGILQALLTKKPVFLYSGLSQLDETPLALLRKRARISHRLDEFTRAVSGYLEGSAGTGVPRGDSQEFIRAYGLHQGDGMSAKRAVTLLGRMVDESSPASSENEESGA